MVATQRLFESVVIEILVKFDEPIARYILRMYEFWGVVDENIRLNKALWMKRLYILIYV